MSDPNRKECSYSEKPNNRQAAISEKKMQIVINNYFKSECNVDTSIRQAFEKGFRIGVKKGLTAQPEIIRCKDCKYGEQDEVGRWFCRGLGCQIGNENGSGYCADAERRTDAETEI